MKHICWVFIFAFSVNSFSQKVTTISFNNESLESVLKHLEEKFDLRFSYRDDIVKNQNFTFSEKNTSLQIILAKIEQTTSLIFEKVNHRYYIIRSKKQLKYKSICAHVFDKTSNKVLQNTNIININQGTGAVTDEKGYFELLNVKETDTISIHYLGFEEKTMLAKEFLNGHCKKIELNRFNEQLNEITLKEYITQGISENADRSIKVLPKKLEILPGLTEPDVLESLQSIPGVQSPNETASGLHIRGGTPDQNLILWDGIKVYQSGHLFGMISAFNPYIIDNVTLYKNGTKAKYGNRISGVIDMNSKKEIPSQLSGGFGFNMTHADAYLKTPLFNNKVGIITSFRRSFTDVVSSFTYKKLNKKVFQNNDDENGLDLASEETNNNFYFIDYSVKAIIDVNKKNKVIINNLFVKNKLNYLDYSLDEDYQNSESDFLTIKNVGSLASWEKQWNKKFKHTISVNTSAYNFNYNGEDNFEDFGTLTEKKENSIKELKLAVATTIKLTEKQSLEAGYQYFNDKVSFSFKRNASYDAKNDYSLSENRTNITHALYAEYTYNNPKKILIDLSMRANTFSVTNNFFLEPRLNFKVYLNKNLKFGLSAEIKNQSTSQIIEFETTGFGLENQIWALADNENFPTLNSKQISTGLNFQKNNWNIDIDGYFKKVKGLTSLTKGFSNTLNIFSAGNSNSYGIDFLIKKKFQNYRTWIAYSLASSDFYFDEIDDGKKYNGNFDIRHNLNWSHTLKLGQFKLSLGWKYRSGKPYTESDLNKNSESPDIIYYEINGKRLPNYNRLDFSGTYEFKLSKNDNWKSKIGFSLLNIYNKKNVLNKTYDLKVLNTSSQNANSQKYQLIENNQYGLGITPNIVFRVYF